MKSLLRLLSIVAALAVGCFAFAGDKKDDACKDCADKSACCASCSTEKGEKACCKDAKKDGKKPKSN